MEAVGRTIVEETRKIIDYHNARVYLVELPDEVVPIAFEGRVGAYEHVDMDLLRCQIGEGFTGWVAEHGEPLLINDANADSRGQTITGTDEIDESMHSRSAPRTSTRTPASGTPGRVGHRA